MSHEKQNRKIHRRNKSDIYFNYRVDNFNNSIMKTKNHETIFEMEHRLRNEAKELAEKNKNRKVTKYDLKS